MSRSTGPASRRSFSLALFVFLSTFLATLAARELLASAWHAFEISGLYSPTDDFSLVWYLAYGILPLLFNAAFGAYFAILCFGRPGRARPRPLAALALLAFWLTAFNLPAFTAAGRERPVEWPPGRLYLPVYSELVLFLPFGNIGAVLGFAIGGLVCIARRPRPSKP